MFELQLTLAKGLAAKGLLQCVLNQQRQLKFVWQGSFSRSGAPARLPRCSWRRWKERPNFTWRPRPVPNDARCPMTLNVEVFATSATKLTNTIIFTTFYNNACLISPISSNLNIFLRIFVPSHLDPSSFGQALKDGAFTPWVRPGRPPELKNARHFVTNRSV